jgi:hypothetical protein
MRVEADVARMSRKVELSAAEHVNSRATDSYPVTQSAETLRRDGLDDPSCGRNV